MTELQMQSCRVNNCPLMGLFSHSLTPATVAEAPALKEAMMCSRRERSAEKLPYRAVSWQCPELQVTGEHSHEGEWHPRGVVSAVPRGMGLQSGEWAGWSSGSGPEGMESGATYKGIMWLSLTCILIPTSPSP